MKFIEINGRRIGSEYPPYIIAELSGNHNGDINRAFELITAAKNAGADAVKLQTYTADTLTLNIDSDDFRITGGLWDGRILYELYQEAHTPWEWHKLLFEKAHELDITIFSSPFDWSAVDYLERLNTPAYKIASFEAVDIPLIKKAASTNKPIIISTGLASLTEIEEAVNAVLSVGTKDIALLHCISAYPAPAEQSCLRTIPDLAHRFNVISGLSDHTLGTATAVTAVALGASIIEKHFTLDRNDGGPDAAFSLEPEELKILCHDCKIAWESLGYVNYKQKKCENNNKIFRRSLYVVEDIKAGEKFTNTNIRSIRPGYGLPPKELENIIGKVSHSSIKCGTALTWEHVVKK